MNENKLSQLWLGLEESLTQLDHEKVSWIDKHLVIDLAEKGELLMENLYRSKEDENPDVIEAVETYLETVKPVIAKLNNQTTGV